MENQEARRTKNNKETEQVERDTRRERQLNRGGIETWSQLYPWNQLPTIELRKGKNNACQRELTMTEKYNINIPTKQCENEKGRGEDKENTRWRLNPVYTITDKRMGQWNEYKNK